MPPVLTKEIIEAITTLVDYNWEKEAEDYEEYLQDNDIDYADILDYATTDTESRHIFPILIKIDNWLYSQRN